MSLEQTNIDGLVILNQTVFKDERGYFIESYNEKKTNKLLGNINFIQDNQSKSFKGVLRGLHFQKPPYSQAKLVSCIEGEILDVALDLRKKSKTFGKFQTNILSNKNNHKLFIPKGFAHGFVVLSKYAIVLYKTDNYYNPEYESGVLWNDPDLNIDWEFDNSKIIISEKDRNLPRFSEIINPF